MRIHAARHRQMVVCQEQRQVLNRFSAGRVTAGELVDALRRAAREQDSGVAAERAKPQYR